MLLGTRTTSGSGANCLGFCTPWIRPSGKMRIGGPPPKLSRNKDWMKRPMPQTQGIDAPNPGVSAQGSRDWQSLTCSIPEPLAREIWKHCRATGQSIGKVVASALAEHLQSDHSAIYQVSTAGALVHGLYKGDTTIASLREHGDFGLGTFDGLDGEMVAFDGVFYQVRGDGKVVIPPLETRTPYAMVTRFPGAVAKTIGPVNSFEELRARLDRLRTSENIFYAIRIDGSFESVLTRSVFPTEEGCPLAEAASHQHEFPLKTIRGTLVGFWSPGYLSTVLVAGYHLHFLSEDKLAGGHLLDCSASELHVQICPEADFRLTLPETRSFLGADLSGDPTADLHKSASSTHGDSSPTPNQRA